MPPVGQAERATQDRIIALFRDELGYRYLGDWTDRDGNSNIEEELLTEWLGKCCYSAAQISVALHKLRTEADNHSRTLYGNNQAVYKLLRYGMPVKTEAGSSCQHTAGSGQQRLPAARLPGDVQRRGWRGRNPENGFVKRVQNTPPR